MIEEEQSQTKVKPKREMTPEMLEKLAAARQKAIQMRKEAAGLKKLEKEALKKQKHEEKLQRKKELEARLKPQQEEEHGFHFEKNGNQPKQEIIPEPQHQPEPERRPVPQRIPSPEPEPIPDPIPEETVKLFFA